MSYRDDRKLNLFVCRKADPESKGRIEQTRMKRIRDANLVIIDDLMYMAMDTREANLFFHLINNLYDKAS